MASIYDLKPRFQALLRPLTNWLAAKGVTANQVTVAAAVVSLATGALVAVYPDSRGVLLIVPLVLFVRMALNAIDGMLAREHDMKSRRGAVLNELGDVISDAGLYLPLALVPGMPSALVTVLVVLGVISEMAGVVAVQIGAERRYDGPLGKSDRAFAFGLIAFLLGIGVEPGRWLVILLSVLVAMAGITIVRRAPPRGYWRTESSGEIQIEIEGYRMSHSVALELQGNSRAATEHTFKTSDGVDLFYRAWRPATESRRAVVLFHRGHEHSGRWQDFVDRMAMDDTWFFAWDARGHGMSPGERGYASSFGRMVQDADEFVRHLSTEFDLPIANMAVVAQSVGAVLATTWVHDYAPPIRAFVIATPALRVKLYIPLAIPGLRVLRMLKPKSFIHSYVKPKMLTHDLEQARMYASDELISSQIAVNILLDLYDTSTRLIRDASAIQTPTLLLMSGNDWVVEQLPQHRLFAKLSSPVKEKVAYPDFYHSTFWEKDRQQPIERTRQFMLAAFDAQKSAPSLLDADRTGATRRKFDRLQCPLRVGSWKWIKFKVQRWTLNTVGRLSKGVQVGWMSGFDSGQSLDHVYQNTPEGFTFLGRLIDKNYLNSPGWRGIRQRKVHMQQLLDDAIEMLRGQGRPIRILDVAAGPGRYVLDTIARHRDKGVEVSATLCDRDVGGLAAGRALAETMGITSVVYRQSDAFSAEAIAAIEPRPTIAIVSGLYELFPSNAPVRESLRGLATAVEPGGVLLYTNQPWHPQQEMIARVLPNRDGEPWVMRCRTQAEMDQLVVAAGFEKVRMLIDDDGIFSVSMAVRK